jgi:DNA-binding response OmpR family regulator
MTNDARAPRSVLVVEDDPVINELVGAYIRLAGFRYHAAHDGSDGLKQAREGLPALIVLDLMLPDVDGFEVCRQLKGEQSTQRIPVVMLTALDRAESRERGFRSGASAYLTKPFNPDRLMEEIRRWATVEL